jgi:hypothetical protein
VEISYCHSPKHGFPQLSRRGHSRKQERRGPGSTTPKFRLGTREIKTKLFQKSETTRKSARKMAPPAHGRADRATEGAGGSPSPGPDLAVTETPVRERSAEKYQTPRTEMALSSIFGTCPALAGAVLAKRRPNLLQASRGTSTYPPSACDRQSAKWWTPLNSKLWTRSC